MTTLVVREADVVRHISKDEYMFNAWGTRDPESHYHYIGRSAIEVLDTSLQAAQIDPREVKRILDLPCGHGRVLRYLKAAFPEAEIHACDILRDGVDFCASILGAVPVYSHVDPTKIPLERETFDLVWVGSLLTHLDSNLWPIFLNLFRSCLRPGGILVFTTHGRYISHLIAKQASTMAIPYYRGITIRYQYERRGFGYVQYDSAIQPRLDRYYGLSLSQPTWVLDQISQMKDMRVVHFAEAAWGAFQDVFACVRHPDWQVAAPPIRRFKYAKSRLRDLLTRSTQA